MVVAIKIEHAPKITVVQLLEGNELYSFLLPSPEPRLKQEADIEGGFKNL